MMSMLMGGGCSANDATMASSGVSAENAHAAVPLHVSPQPVKYLDSDGADDAVRECAYEWMPGPWAADAAP